MKQTNQVPDLLIIDEADFAESDLDHPFAQEAQLVETDELVLTAEDLLQYRIIKEGCQRWPS